MGILEKDVAKRQRRAYIQKLVLQTVAAAGLIGVALVAPNVLKIFPNFNGDRQQKYRVNLTLRRLREQGFLAFEQKVGGSVARLTEKGNKALRLLENRDFKLAKPRRWDGKWRIIVFDVKEERKAVRDKIRRTLVHIGFLRLQDSVWVFPYDCEDLIMLLKADFKIGKDVLYIIADRIENDRILKNQFGLS